MGNAEELAFDWLERLECALVSGDEELIGALFTPEGCWRDLVALTWDLRQEHGRANVARSLAARAGEVAPSSFAVDTGRPAPSTIPDSDATLIEVFFTFETLAGSADGLVHLAEDPENPRRLRAELLLTRLVGLRDAPAQWPDFGRYDETRGRIHAKPSTDPTTEPEVLIIGGGQSGVMTAAHLARLGHDALIVEKHPQVGDTWRKRYDSLMLHQPHGMCYFPFIKYPENFPDYLSKDLLADWFESYVKLLSINYWTSTEFIAGKYDETSGTWDAELRAADGSIRHLHPRHIVMATGGSGLPKIPSLPGLSEFEGSVIHSTQFKSGEDFTDKRTLVVGVGSSAHDLAVDVTKHGGRVTMLQRNPVIVVDLETANLAYGDFNARVVSTELVDMRMLANLTYPLLKRACIQLKDLGSQLDRELQEGLKKAGMVLTDGEHGGGWLYQYWDTAAGYYINVGGAEAIIAGDIKVLQSIDVKQFVPSGLELIDGTRVDFDAVVLATGFENQRVQIERFFGTEVAEAIGDVWGFEVGGEIGKACWKRLPQPGLWIMGGGFAPARLHSPLVALQIAADIRGIVPQQSEITTRSDNELKAPLH